MDMQLLSLFFSNILACVVIPDSLRKCRTTLIPKRGDQALRKNWRPITICSCILRILYKILASRLSLLHLQHTQKGFRSMDGCPANLLLVQSIIKERRESAKPYNIITIDLKKAFDTVRHTSITRALRRLRVDGRIRTLIENQYTDATTTIT